MDAEQKTMVSFRLPVTTVERLDFIVRNTDTPGIKSRSTALISAVDGFLATQEQRLVQLGVIPKKTR